MIISMAKAPLFVVYSDVSVSFIGRGDTEPPSSHDIVLYWPLRGHRSPSFVYIRALYVKYLIDSAMLLETNV